MDRQSEKPIGSKNGQDLYQTYIGQSRYTETNMNLLWCITMEKQSFLIKKKKKEEEDKKKAELNHEPSRQTTKNSPLNRSSIVPWFFYLS